MKKWILPALLLLLLVACNTAPKENGQADEEKDPAAEETSAEDSESNDEGVPASAAEDKDEEETAEEDASSDNNNESDTNDAEDVKDNKPQEPQYTVNTANSSIQPIGEANPEVVLLTIDDAPDYYALEMAKTLKELNVKAIFFVNGHFLLNEAEQAVLKEIYDMGFPIGNHTMNHKSLRQISEEEQYEEIVPLNDLVEEITGERPRFFRAPFGINTDYANELVEEEGMILMNWTYGYDWEKDYMNAEALADIMINTELLTSGANLLLHDREWTNDALEGIVKGLQDKGYEIVDPDLIGKADAGKADEQ
jgi:peptidoglycan/xylan/chitin deacetylase (PgdA/CDA1 family)